MSNEINNTDDMLINKTDDKATLILKIAFLRDWDNNETAFEFIEYAKNVEIEEVWQWVSEEMMA